MSPQEQKNLYEQLIVSVLNDNSQLKAEKAKLEFKTTNKLILKVGKRI